MISSLSTSKKPRLLDIDKLTGVAITLVVIGHLETSPYTNLIELKWYKILKVFIYSFHMPLFMFISGYIWSYTYPKVTTISEYVVYIKKKFFRLMPAYIFFAVIIFLSKFFLDNHLFINNKVNSFIEFFNVFYRPTASYAGFLWYIYVLFEYYIFFPIILFLLKGNIKLLLILTFPLFFVKFTDFFAITFFLNFLFFFSLGVFAEKESKVYLQFIDRYHYELVIFFLVLIFLFFIINVPIFVMGFFSIPALHALVRNYISGKDKILANIGYFSFSIYLMNVPVIGFFKAASFEIFGHSYDYFYLLSILLIILGVSVPIILKKYIINQFQFVKAYF